jgi:hypothetical protein
MVNTHRLLISCLSYVEFHFMQDYTKVIMVDGFWHTKITLYKSKKRNNEVKFTRSRECCNNLISYWMYLISMILINSYISIASIQYFFCMKLHQLGNYYVEKSKKATFSSYSRCYYQIKYIFFYIIKYIDWWCFCFFSSISNVLFGSGMNLILL